MKKYLKRRKVNKEKKYGFIRNFAIFTMQIDLIWAHLRHNTFPISFYMQNKMIETSLTIINFKKIFQKSNHPNPPPPLSALHVPLVNPGPQWTGHRCREACQNFIILMNPAKGELRYFCRGEGRDTAQNLQISKDCVVKNIYIIACTAYIT